MAATCRSATSGGSTPDTRPVFAQGSTLDADWWSMDSSLGAFELAPAQGRSDNGFTLVELVIAISLAGFVFVAIALSLGGALRAVAVQKARTQGNEIATQGIEDLQRYAYS